MPQRLLFTLSIVSTFAIAGSPPAIAANLTTLVSFDGANGANPVNGLVFDVVGNLYGTTSKGGTNNAGTIYRLDSATKHLSTLASFTGNNGNGPLGSFVVDSTGNVYGSTTSGGSSNRGTVFEYSASSKQLSAIVNFDGSNGIGPQGGLVADSLGNLYGTTPLAAGDGYGNVFRVAAGSHEFSTIVNFTGQDGALPFGSLIFDSDGNLYGTTNNGGADFAGNIFKVSTLTNKLKTIAMFDNTNGNSPLAGVVSDSDGNLYGTASGGGAYNRGTVFKVAAGTNEITTLYSFTGGLDGANPRASLILDAAGNLYGTVPYGGVNNAGNVFKISVGTNQFSTLVSFDGTNGANPYANLVADSTGNLYGTTSGLSIGGEGTIFEITDSGFVVPEASSLLLAGFGLAAFAYPCFRQVRETRQPSLIEE